MSENTGLHSVLQVSEDQVREPGPPPQACHQLRPEVPLAALERLRAEPPHDDQQAGRGESLQYFDSGLKIFKGEGFYGGAVQRPDHQAHQPRRLDHMGGHLSRGK